MRFLILTLLLGTLGGTALHAQSSPSPKSVFAGGILLGTSAYGGDLRSNNTIFIDQPDVTLGLGLRYQFANVWAVRADAQYIRLRADDANDNAQRQRRGYSFNSNVVEFSLRGEWHPLGTLRPLDQPFNQAWSPYLFGGVGLALIDANPDFNGDTERPGISADLNSDENSTLVLPFGLGLRYDLSESLAFGLEYGLRVSTTDYLDGISEVANPDKNDRYGVLTLQIWKRFGSK